MSEFLIPNFKYGLDTRKEQLSSQIGTLAVLKNAYINEGGELVKRGRFTDLDAYISLDTLGQTGMFPGVFVDTTFYIFGSALPIGTSVTQSQPVIVTPLSQTYFTAIYQQVKHPSLTNDTAVNYDNTKHRMTQLVFADVYNNKTLVVIQYADNNQFVFYDGTLVQQSANGLVLSGRNTVADLSDDLDRQFTPIGWDVNANVDENAVAQNGATMVHSPIGDYFGGILSVNSANGVFGIRQFPYAGAPVPGVKASAKFSITVNTGTFEVLAPSQAETTTPTVSLAGIPIPANVGGAASTAIDIATAINDFTSDHGYTAVNDGINVEVFAPLGYDLTVALDLTVNVTSGTVVGGATTGTALTATITTPAIIGTNASGRVSFADGVLTVERFVSVPTGVYTVRAYLRMTVAGGSPAYTYDWNESFTGSANGMSPVLSTTQNLLPELQMTPNTVVTGTFKCVVTDNTAGTPLTAIRFITVQLICTYVQGS